MTKIDWSQPVLCKGTCGKELVKRSLPNLDKTKSKLIARGMCSHCYKTSQGIVGFYGCKSEFTETHQKCIHCLEWRILEEFSKDIRFLSGRGSRCKSCKNDRYYSKYRLTKYGLSEEEYVRLQESQQGKCYICPTIPHGKSKGNSLNIDHDHDTGEVRKLLCSPCNMALGHFKDDIGIIEKAIAYLEGPNIVFHETMTTSNYSGRYGRYGINELGFEYLIDLVSNLCPLCEHPTPKSIDHDHSCCDGNKSCGKCIRGVICRKCNAGLGNAKDSIEILQTMVKYLQEH